MHKLLTTFAVLFLAACGAASSGDQEARAVTAALSYADWCSSCKTLDPKISAVREANNLDGITFVTLDYTDRDAEAFLAAADTAGVGEAVRTQFEAEIKTGLLVLIDPATQEVISVINKTMTETEILAAFRASTAG